MRRGIYIGLGVVLFVAVLWGVHYLILDGTTKVGLQTTPLAPVVSQSLSNTGTGSVPSIGKDYNIVNVQYFDNNTWAVAHIEPVGKSGDPGVVILQQSGNTYKTVAGPGGVFDTSILSKVPSDVGQYLNNQGLILVTEQQ